MTLERVVGHESTKTVERAESSESIDGHKRAVSADSNVQEQRAVKWESTIATNATNYLKEKPMEAPRFLAIEELLKRRVTMSELTAGKVQYWMTDEDRMDVQRRVAAGESQVDLATEYNVSKATICRIVKEKLLP